MVQAQDIVGPVVFFGAKTSGRPDGKLEQFQVAVGN